MIQEVFIDDIRFRHTGIRSYYVSEYGVVANIKFNNETIVKVHKLKTFKSRCGNYLRVPLKYEPNKERKYYIHRLVYSAFCGELIDGLVIDHIDANTMNNHYTNLRQTTQKGNIENAIAHGNFGNNHCTTISVYDKNTEATSEYNSVKEFLNTLDIVNRNGSLNQLQKYKQYKNRYVITKKGQQTIESIA